MKKLKLLLAFCALLIGWSNASAQITDVTSTYITNPSFDLGTDGTPKSTGKSFVAPYSWTPTDMPSSGTHNFSILSASETSDTSPSGFGTTVAPSNGDYYYFARHSWASSLTTILTQTSKAALPVGKYLLTIDYKIAKSSGNLTPNGYLTLQAKQGGISLNSRNSTISASQNNTYFNTAAWSTLLVPFEVTSEGNVDFIITFNFNPTSANIPQEAIIIDNVRLNKNYVQPVADNTTDLYFKNETTGQFLSAGHTWGTHASVDNYGQEITATLSDGVYKLKTQQYNAYVGGLYMDSGSANEWAFLETSSGSGKYYMTQNGTNFMTSNGAGAELVNVTSPTDASVWTIVSKADRKAAAMSSATIDSPSDVTFLIADANFNRNAISSVWNGTSKTSDDKTNLNLAGGNNDNMCAESLHATFSISQTLNELSDGVYGLTAQGFYRQDGTDNDHLPYFYLGDEKATFPIRTGSENNMSSASTSFSAGLYTIDPIYVRVEDGSVALGAKLTDENYNLWCIWDNFQLKYYGDVTVAAVKMKASVDAYNAAMNEAKAFTESSMQASDWTALQGAITSNTLDLNDPSLTESALNTATSNLIAANAAATVAVTYKSVITTINGGTNVDLTSFIDNPSFESNGTGWTNNGMAFQSNDSFGKTGSKYAEAWQPNGTKSISQTISVLPAGIYQLSVHAKARGVTSAKIFANSNELALTIADAENDYNLTFDISDRTALNIGFEGVGTGAGNSWLALDNFRLIYVGSVEDLTYTLATGKMASDKATAQSTAETTFLADKTLANYNALIAAISEAEASVANYAKLKAAIDKANGVKDANNFVTAAATTDFENEISTATTAWTNETYSDAEATAEVTTLGSAVSGWHAIAIEGKAGAYIASAWDKTNDNWWEDPYINTWSTEGDNDGSGFSVPFFEYFADDKHNLPTKTMTATLTGLENGVYEVELWARVQRRSDADFNANNSMITMNVNGGDAVSIMSDTEHNVGTGGNVMRLGHYTATGIVTDGTLTLSIDVKDGSNVHWLSWRDVTYTKVAPATFAASISSTIGVATLYTPYALNFSGADGLKAYTAVVSGEEVVVTEVSNVPANTGVILKGAKGDYNIPVIAASNEAQGDLTGNATEATAFDAFAGYDIYVLALNTSGDAQFQKATEGSVAAGKAFLKISNTNPVKAFRVVDGTATGVVAPEVAEAEEEEEILYNTAGVRVGKDYKGIVINQKGEKRLQK